jgi:hypothetical protein|tara:strand:+ start:4390 stop:4665 length:276 start_codon:yes stop_codon:yes gene_type:complete
MSDLKSKRLGGLWKKVTPAGKTLWSGNFKVQDINDALAHVSPHDADVQITLWENSEEDKHRANSPDGSLAVGEKWQKPSADTELNSKDIPF